MSDFRADDCDLDELRRIVETESDLADYPHSAGEAEGAVVYEAGHFASLPEAETRSLDQELARVLRDGPGIVVIKGAFAGDTLDAVSVVFEELIARQRAEGFAIHRNWRVDEPFDETFVAQDKDCVTVRKGYHSSVAAPSSHMFFLNYLAGDLYDTERTTPPCFHPDFTWIQDNWDQGGWDLPVVGP